MNQDAKQMREFCQKWLIDSRKREVNDPQLTKNILAIMNEMHKRLTILEGATLQSLEDISA
jgi:hypothetical protein